jgi:ferredoxin
LISAPQRKLFTPSGHLLGTLPRLTLYLHIQKSSKAGLWRAVVCLKIQGFAIPDSRLDRTGHMTHVVTESCIRCRYTDCVDVCPVDCFREGPNFLTIDPDECIDCAVCVAECPVNAIYAEEDTPADQQQFIKLNVELARLWPSITKSKEALPEADEWKDVKDKLQYLQR